MTMPIIWFIVAAIMFVGEMICPIFFMFWFAIGAIGALVVSFITANITVQVIVFVVISCVLLLFMKPLTNKLKTKTKDELNTNSVIGKHAVVVEEINDLKGTGKVKINGEVWKALSDDETAIILTDSQVTVERIDGVKLIVRACENA